MRLLVEISPFGLRYLGVSRSRCDNHKSAYVLYRSAALFSGTPQAVYWAAALSTHTVGRYR